MFCNSQIESFTLILLLQHLPPSSQVYPSKALSAASRPPASQATQYPTRPGRRRNTPWLAQSPTLPMHHMAPHLMWSTCVPRKAQGIPLPHPSGSPSAADASHILNWHALHNVQLVLCNSVHSVQHLCVNKLLLLTRAGHSSY